MDFSLFSLVVSCASKLNNGDLVSRRKALSVSLLERAEENSIDSIFSVSFFGESIVNSSEEEEDSSFE